MSGEPPVKVGVLTVSDGCAAGTREDRSGATIVSWCRQCGYEANLHEVVPDEQGRIVSTLVAWADGGQLDVVLTTGGTGLGSRDVTPEAMGSVLERDAVSCSGRIYQ